MKYSENWDLTTIPDEPLYSEVGRRNSEKREVKSGGRPKKLKKCKHCGIRFGAREMRQHRCTAISPS
jgi:hypothetical protein